MSFSICDVQNATSLRRKIACSAMERVINSSIVYIWNPNNVVMSQLCRFITIRYVGRDYRF